MTEHNQDQDLAATAPRNIVVGVGGGIAAYKACHLIRNFTEGGDHVRVVPTAAALNFVGAATFEALSGNPVSTTVFDAVDEVRHVAVGQQADAIVIAPATADLIARLAAGRADDLLSATVLVATCPVIIAPAMHTEMWYNPATQDNIATLRRRGITVMEPAHGRLTGHDSGPGRLPEPEQIAAIVRTRLAGWEINHSWAGKKVVVSAGGTLEAIDPVRFVGNRSSGLQGMAIAEIAAHRGAEVVVVLANSVSMPVPSGARIVPVESAVELAEAMAAERDSADVIIMAAAVADYRPETVAPAKLKKGQRDNELSTIRLVENPDILAGLVADRAQAGSSEVIVGFAAETGDDSHSAVEFAQAKFERKGCDILMANEVGPGKVFGQTRSQGWILRRGSAPTEVPAGSKYEVAVQLLAAVDELWRTEH